MVTESFPIEDRGFRAPGTGHMVAGSLIGAVGAYLFQLVGGRALGTEAFAPISVLWTVFFILATVVLVPLEQYITREASLGRRVLRSNLGPIVSVTGGAAVAGGAFVLITSDALFDGELVFAIQLVLLVVGYSMLLVGKGVLAGHRQFKNIGWILFWETTLRLAAGIIFLGFVVNAQVIGWAMVIAPLVALGTRFWRFDVAAAQPRPAGQAKSFLGAYIAGSAASQLLLAGAPLGIAALGGGPALISITFVTFTLYRGPLTLIYALQGRILPYLVRLSEEGSSGLRRISLGVLVGGGVLAVAGGGVGYLVGPEVVTLLFGPEFEPDRLVAAMAAAGVVAASTAQIAGQILVAAGGTGKLATAWATGLAAAVVVLFVQPGAIDRTVAFGFLLGEATAAIVVAAMTLGVRRSGPVDASV
jgi:O-antigen/teichoic acid export membrane protein